MPRFELKKGCLFVDAYDLDKPNPHDAPDRSKQDIPYAHVMDKSQAQLKADCPYTTLNDVAGFIGRFIVMGVDTETILPKIVASEYGISEDKAKDEVKAVLVIMEDYLQPRLTPRGHMAPKSHLKGKHKGVYELNFRVNPIGIGVFKG
jgi:hypothetical protein